MAGETAVAKPQGARKRGVSGHETHCFVAMPSGRNLQEREWFEGWYKVVIEPAVRQANYEPILSVLGDQPNAINDEVRTHLAIDAMVVFDLGGVTAESDPNPNVMYELGIRHAFSLPMVTMAWRGQRLPFDVANQRTIMEDRGFKYIEVNKTKLTSFIASAKQGEYYKPMEAVNRVAAIEAISYSPTADETLKVLVHQFQEFKQSVLHQLAKQQASIEGIRNPAISTFIGQVPTATSAGTITSLLASGSSGVVYPWWESSSSAASSISTSSTSQESAPPATS